ncbi:MAG: sensor histidine kinase [Candidatus Melainabacteria bacterium]|nr:sensor histidine kinase [Candidatus Melainabacteria bacterium]
MNSENVVELSAGENDTDRFFHYGLYRQIKFVEEAILIVSAVSHLLMLRLVPPTDLYVNRWTITVVFLVVYFLLTRIDLVERSFHSRIVVLSLCTLAACGAYMIGQPIMINPLFAVLVARAVLFFEDKTGWSISLAIFLFLCLASFLRAWAGTDGLDPASALILLIPAFFYGTLWQGVVMAIVGLLVDSLIESKKQYLKMERLNKEISSLAADLERSRIARDIHDGVGHSLTALSVQLEVARKLISRDPVKSERALGEAEQMAKHCLRDVRNSIALMRVDDFDFQEAFSTLVNGIESGGSIKIDQNVQIPMLPTVIAYQIFRVIQESCTNSLRHSEADRLEISIVPIEQELNIVVRDNGKGFDTDAKFNSFGLTGIKERVTDLKGRVEIASTKGRGTTVTVLIPLSVSLPS